MALDLAFVAGCVSRCGLRPANRGLWMPDGDRAVYVWDSFGSPGQRVDVGGAQHAAGGGSAVARVERALARQHGRIGTARRLAVGTGRCRGGGAGASTRGRDRLLGAVAVDIAHHLPTGVSQFGCVVWRPPRCPLLAVGDGGAHALLFLPHGAAPVRDAQLVACGRIAPPAFRAGVERAAPPAHHERTGRGCTLVDRFLAYHLSLVYYWMLVVVYMVSPATSYNFSELLEKHAHDTYAEFVEQNAARLRMLPAPEVAVQYYREGELYAFAPIAQGQTAPARRPPVESLYDVFVNVRDDEAEHVKTMEACQRDDFVTSHTEMPTTYVPRRETSSDSPTTPQGDVVHLTDAPYRIRVEEDRQRWKHWIDETGRYASARIDEGQQRHEHHHGASHGEHPDKQRTAANLPDYEDGLGL
eukprot:ctg_597.g288